MDLQTPDLLRYRQEFLNLTIIRWEKLPDFGVYNDQVLSIIEKELSFLHSKPEERIITPAMINNYVKLGLIERPIKKKYYRVHLAKLITITLLKQILPLQDVHNGMALLVSLKGEGEAYNSFCEEMEQSFHQLYHYLGLSENEAFTIHRTSNRNIALQTATEALAKKLFTQKVITNNGLYGHEQKGEKPIEE